MDSSAETRIGSMLGPYRLTSILGQGGMGTVFRGEDTFTGREVAVKLLHASFAKDPGVAQRFIREARAAVSLRHPNVVEVLHMNQDAVGVVYMVLELLDGRSLDAHLRRQGPIHITEALGYLLPIMSALDVAHEKGIVHRDIKPENIFLSETSGGVVPKLLDFGIAKMADAVTGFSTNAGAIMGSPAYMSPEQAMGSHKIGPPTDVWAMGVVIFECLTGKSPFAAADAQKCLAKVLTSEPPPLQTVAAGVPRDVALLVESTLNKESPERPTMRELRLSLSSFVSVPPPAPEISATRISGVDYTSIKEAPEQAFPASPSTMGLAATDPFHSPAFELAGKSKELPSSPPIPLAVANTAPQIASSEESDGTLMPASSDPHPRRSSKGVKLGAAALLLASVGAGFVLVGRWGEENAADSPADAPVIAHESDFIDGRKDVAPEPEPADKTEPSVEHDAAQGAVAPSPDDPAALAAQIAASAPEAAATKSATSVPTDTLKAKAKAHAKASTPPSAKPPQPPAPSAEEILRKKREERINKIPSISDL